MTFLAAVQVVGCDYAEKIHQEMLVLEEAGYAGTTFPGVIEAEG